MDNWVYFSKKDNTPAIKVGNDRGAKAPPPGTGQEAQTGLRAERRPFYFFLLDKGRLSLAINRAIVRAGPEARGA